MADNDGQQRWLLLVVTIMVITTAVIDNGCNQLSCCFLCGCSKFVKAPAFACALCWGSQNTSIDRLRLASSHPDIAKVVNVCILPKTRWCSPVRTLDPSDFKLMVKSGLKSGIHVNQNMPLLQSSGRFSMWPGILHPDDLDFQGPKKMGVKIPSDVQM